MFEIIGTGGCCKNAGSIVKCGQDCRAFDGWSVLTGPDGGCPQYFCTQRAAGKGAALWSGLYDSDITVSKQKGI